MRKATGWERLKVGLINFKDGIAGVFDSIDDSLTLKNYNVSSLDVCFFFEFILNIIKSISIVEHSA